MSIRTAAKLLAASTVAMVRKIETRDVLGISGVILIGVAAGALAIGVCLFYLGVLHPLIVQRFGRA